MNIAVSECVPTANVAIAVAVLLDTGTGLPMLFVPSLKCTEPVAADGDRGAVNVCIVPSTAGDTGVTVSTVVVATDPGTGLITYVTAYRTRSRHAARRR